MSERLLLVEDDLRMREIVHDYFEAKGFAVTEAKNGAAACDVLADAVFDIVLLDIMMPKLDGFAVCKAIRKNSDVPIIFLTARSEEEDKLNGFMLGADDYMTKPFSLPVLYAKVTALLKRANGQVLNDSINICGIHIDVKCQKVTVNNQEIILAPKEYELLLCLIKNKDRILTRDMLLNTIWGYDFSGYDRVVDTHIKKLRAALGDKAGCIRTVIKAGYTFEEAGV